MIEYIFVLIVGVAIGAILAWMKIQAGLDRMAEQEAELERVIEQLEDGT